MSIDRFDCMTPTSQTIMECCSQQIRNRRTSSSHTLPCCNSRMYNPAKKCCSSRKPTLTGTRTGMLCPVKFCNWACEFSLTMQSESSAASKLSPRAIYPTGFHHSLSIMRIQHDCRPSALKQPMPCSCNICLSQARTDMLALSFLLKGVHYPASIKLLLNS